ncbi:MAG TPA: hypothetical protein DCZ75_01800 [Geobacter sp.]|nr:hypothetical protein [Geobacter sp.]
MSLQILIISDNGSFAAYLNELLTDAGHRASAVLEETEGFAAIRRQKPDLVIVAVEASRIPYLAIEHRARTATGTRTLPLIVISECLRLEGELLHVFDFIPKPLDVRRLLNDLALLVRRLDAWTGIQHEMSGELFRAFSEHILSCTGLHFDMRNRASLVRGLGKRMSALCLESYGEYLSYLKLHGEDRHELQKLLQFLTVGETYFFRYPAHFDALHQRFANAPPPVAQPIRIWSAGCSTGEEPYSIAMTLMQALPDWRERDIKIIATDINNRSLKQARDGVYSPWSMRITQRCQRTHYFDRVGESFLIRDEVKGLVEFHHLNLSAPCAERICQELSELDAIFCRNVMIYFPQEQVEPMLQRFSAALKVSGQLFLGHAEALLQQNLDLEVCRQGQSFYYRKTGKPTPHAAQSAKGTQPQPAPSPAPAQPLREEIPLPPKRSSKVRTAAPQPRQAPPAPPTAPQVPDAAMLTARRLFDEEDFDAAFELLEQTLSQHPDHAEALVLKGFILAGRGHLEEALETCQRVMALNDLLPEAYFLKGVVLDASDLLTEAADEYRKALLLDHDFIMPRYHMGRLHLRLGRIKEAAREIRNSIRILAKRDEDGTVPYSGGLTRAVCMLQLQSALARVA